jgi:ubiquinone/menaquinone biosynthesis C-methylase UbiE
MVDDNRVPAGPDATADVGRFYDRMAPRYDRVIRLPERLLFAGGREWACRQARGDVLEFAVGTGRNFPFYPEGVRLAGVELSPKMLAVARDRAAALGRSVDLRVGDVQDLDWPDASVDTVVSTLSMCSIPDERRAIAEAWRVLRPGGRLVLLEHVRSPNRLVRAGQRILEPLTVRFQHDHLLREPLDTVTRQGFVVDDFERSKWGIVERLAAHKPRDEAGGAPHSR